MTQTPYMSRFHLVMLPGYASGYICTACVILYLVLSGAQLGPLASSTMREEREAVNAVLNSSSSYANSTVETCERAMRDEFDYAEKTSIRSTQWFLVHSKGSGDANGVQRAFNLLAASELVMLVWWLKVSLWDRKIVYPMTTAAVAAMVAIIGATQAHLQKRAPLVHLPLLCRQEIEDLSGGVVYYWWSSLGWNFHADAPYSIVANVLMSWTLIDTCETHRIQLLVFGLYDTVAHASVLIATGRASYWGAVGALALTLVLISLARAIDKQANNCVARRQLGALGLSNLDGTDDELDRINKTHVIGSDDSGEE